MQTLIYVYRYISFMSPSLEQSQRKLHMMKSKENSKSEKRFSLFVDEKKGWMEVWMDAKNEIRKSKKNEKKKIMLSLHKKKKSNVLVI